jgi:hypothetical protein
MDLTNCSSKPTLRISTDRGLLPCYGSALHSFRPYYECTRYFMDEHFWPLFEFRVGLQFRLDKASNILSDQVIRHGYGLRQWFQHPLDIDVEATSRQQLNVSEPRVSDEIAEDSEENVSRFALIHGIDGDVYSVKRVKSSRKSRQKLRITGFPALLMHLVYNIRNKVRLSTQLTEKPRKKGTDSSWLCPK